MLEVFHSSEQNLHVTTWLVCPDRMQLNTLCVLHPIARLGRFSGRVHPAKSVGHGIDPHLDRCESPIPQVGIVVHEPI
jgi:hypothetical protein